MLLVKVLTDKDEPALAQLVLLPFLLEGPSVEHAHTLEDILLLLACNSQDALVTIEVRTHGTYDLINPRRELPERQVARKATTSRYNRWIVLVLAICAQELGIH